ncbi:SufD family Fe-S cluster assembly protein, partial [Francisella tularensis subsp. holarctica]|uniref:SufD family Fe-S cluster assembly protein n=1 Tax=Francisella tularensis TaxID=263 RepID=UPI002381CF10
ISAGKASKAYRGLVRISQNAANARNFSQCDSLLIGHNCGAHNYPYIENKSNSSQIENEATTSKISDDQLFYCKKRGLSEEDAIAMIVNGFCKEVFKTLPLEFAVE